MNRSHAFSKYHYGLPIQLSLVICPDDCSSVAPEVAFSECSPDVNEARIDKVYLTNVGQGLADWGDINEWTSRLSNTGSAIDDIRTLFGIGAKAAPESTEIKISLGRTIYGKKKHTITFKIDETNPTNHAMLRQLECGGTFLIWYETSGGLLFGSTDGIVVSIKIDMVIPDDAQQLITYEVTLTWEDRFTEPYIVSPLV